MTYESKIVTVNFRVNDNVHPIEIAARLRMVIDGSSYDLDEKLKWIHDNLLNGTVYGDENTPLTVFLDGEEDENNV